MKGLLLVEIVKIGHSLEVGIPHVVLLTSIRVLVVHWGMAAGVIVVLLGWEWIQHEILRLCAHLRL